MTVSWTHGTASDSTDDPGVYPMSLVLPTGCKAHGGWAEPAREFGNRSAHYSCTPTGYTGHDWAGTSLIGTTVTVDGSTTYITYLFSGDPGQMLRVHLWTLT